MTLTLKMALRKLLLCCNKISSPQPIYRELLDYYETTWVKLKIKQKESSKSFFFLLVVFVRIKIDVGLGRMCLFDFSSEKIQFVLFDQPNNPGAMHINDLDGWKIVFKMHELPFSTIAETSSKTNGALMRSVKFLSPGAAVYHYKSSIRPFMKRCCHV